MKNWSFNSNLEYNEYSAKYANGYWPFQVTKDGVRYSDICA